MELTVKLLMEAVFIAKVLNDPKLPCMVLTVIQDSSAQPPRSVLIVRFVIDPTWLDSVLTSRLDTARFCMVLPSKVKPSIELTVKLLMEAAFIAKLLNDPKLPCMVLTVIQDNSAQPPRSVLTFKSVKDPTWLDSVLTSRLDTARFRNVALSSTVKLIELTFNVLIDALSMLNVLNDPKLPCVVLTVIQDNSAQFPLSVLTFKSVIDPTWLDSVLTSRLDTVRFCIVLPSNVKPLIVLTFNVLMEALFIAKVLKEPTLP
jgi:hypothetical protein